MNRLKLENKASFLFDLHLDLEVYFNHQLRSFINTPFKSLSVFYSKRHFDIPQAKKVGLKFLVVQIQSLNYNNLKKTIEPLEDINIFLENFNNFIKVIKKYKSFKIIKHISDFFGIKKNQIGIFLGVEGLNFVKNLKEVEMLWNSGIRVFGLTWNFDNYLAGGLNSKRSLSNLGEKVVKFLVKKEAIIDCAHLNFNSAMAVIKLAPKNFIFSHNNIKKVFNFSQNIDDRIFKLIKNKETLIGLTLLPPALSNINKKKPFFNDWLSHYNFLIKENKKLIALGTDYFGFDFKHTPIGAENYNIFNKNLIKFKVDKELIFKNTLDYFYNKIRKWK
mgnify:CR=1 FL=1